MSLLKKKCSDCQRLRSCQRCWEATAEAGQHPKLSLLMPVTAGLWWEHSYWISALVMEVVGANIFFFFYTWWLGCGFTGEVVVVVGMGVGEVIYRFFL